MADGAPADELVQVVVTDWHHWNRLVCGQPVTGRSSTGICTDVADVAEHERHRVELDEAGTRRSYTQTEELTNEREEGEEVRRQWEGGRKGGKE